MEREGVLQEFWLDEKQNGTCILHWVGTRKYGEILQRAFLDIACGGIANDADARYDFRIALTGCSSVRVEEIESFLLLLLGRINIHDGLTECYALDYHKKPADGGKLERTLVGKTVRTAKPYDREWNRGSRHAGEVIADWMAEFASAHPAYADADLVTSVPPSNPEKDFDLPAFLAEEVAARLRKPFAPVLVKTRVTRQMKGIKSIRAKIENVRGAFRVEGDVEGSSVLLIDDIYHGGHSLNEAAKTLFAGGADPVFGLVATKTWREL
ncbi:MAG: ComF family protein [Planctomycetota bacterium]|nr:MAG: ComF family protein [Planctomycetota bacterium]